jgi:hypothetical protein
LYAGSPHRIDGNSFSYKFGGGDFVNAGFCDRNAQVSLLVVDPFVAVAFLRITFGIPENAAEEQESVCKDPCHRSQILTHKDR